jgi:RimJ/RimL family protein N-acetyltransferase
MGDFRIETERLVMRQWRIEDAAVMHAMGRDVRVMKHLGPRLAAADAHALVAGQIVNQGLFGHCFWPVERRSDGVLLGFCGVQPGPVDTPVEGRMEIGWRLAHHAWGQGYALEAARASLEWAWRNLPDPEIIAMTVAANNRSWGLMKRLKMTRRSELDFDHPALSERDRLSAHIVYSAARPQ